MFYSCREKRLANVERVSDLSTCRRHMQSQHPVRVLYLSYPLRLLCVLINCYLACVSLMVQEDRL